MTPAERITLWLARMRASGRAAVLSRLVIGIAGAVAVLVPASRPWDELDVVPLVAVALLVACVVLPDSAAALLFIGVVSAGWLLRAPGDVGWDVVVTGFALLAVHLSSAFAAQFPSYAKVDRRTLRRWLLPASIAAALGPVAAVAAALIRGAEVPGSVLLTVAALAAATGGVWFAAGQSISGRNDGI
ncbi:MAG TPA: hypothetical protein VFT31_18345 [Kribbella sp.]|nr:hypothetical protein [Kribbella sp.]